MPHIRWSLPKIADHQPRFPLVVVNQQPTTTIHSDNAMWVKVHFFAPFQLTALGGSRIRHCNYVNMLLNEQNHLSISSLKGIPNQTPSFQTSFYSNDLTFNWWNKHSHSWKQWETEDEKVLMLWAHSRHCFSKKQQQKPLLHMKSLPVVHFTLQRDENAVIHKHILWLWVAC